MRPDSQEKHSNNLFRLIIEFLIWGIAIGGAIFLMGYSISFRSAAFPIMQPYLIFLGLLFGGLVFVLGSYFGSKEDEEDE